MLIHRISPGDTLSSVAAAYGITESRLRQINGLSGEDAPVVGQELVILKPEQIYTVREGDTLYSIAEQTGTTVRSLLAENPSLGGNPLLYPGQTLVISSAAGRERPVIVNGYTYPFIEEQVLRRVLPYLTYLTVFTYGFTESGELIPADDGELLETAKRYGVGALLLISTLGEDGRFNNTLSGRLFRDEAAQQRLIDGLLATVAEKGYRGVEVDFEYVPGEEADDYVLFLQRLGGALRSAGYLLFAALAPKTSADQPGLLYEGHDYRGIGETVDYAILMTYEWGYKYGPPNAVAPIPNVEAVVRYAVSEIPPEKLLLGVPNYGYDWPLPFEEGVTEAESLPITEAVRQAGEVGAAIGYDEIKQAPNYSYTSDGVLHTVWFESASSIAAKLSLVSEYGLAGISIWNIMRYFPQLYAVLNGTFDIDGPRR